MPLSLVDLVLILFCSLLDTPKTPLLLNPTNEEIALSNPPALRWTTSERSLRYHLQVSLTDDFSDLVVDIDTLTTSEYGSLPLLSLQTYYWRVRAEGHEGAWTNWSHHHTFRTKIGVLGKVTDCHVYDCAVTDSFAFLACHATCRIVDISNRKKPKVVRRRAIASSLIEYNDGYLYTFGDILTTDRYHLTITDVTNQLYPEIRGKCTVGFTYNECYDFVIDSQHCYVASQESGLVIIDVSDPESPTVLATVPQSHSYYTGVDKKDNFLLVVKAWDGIAVFNVADPANPDKIGMYDTGHWIASIAISDTLALLAGELIDIVDISDLPKMTTLCSFEGPAQAVTGAGEYLMVTKSKTVEIYNISDVSNPSFVGDIRVRSRPLYRSGSIDADGMLYLAAGKEGFLILKIRE